jgi:hypothetical protein
MAGMPTNVLGASGLRVARCDFDGDFTSPEAHANARRIVACVNACEGLPTELIEKHGVTRSGIAKGVAELTKQRDELVAFIQEWLERQGDDVSYMTEKARAALAAVKDRGNAKVSGVPPQD